MRALLCLLALVACACAQPTVAGFVTAANTTMRLAPQPLVFFNETYQEVDFTVDVDASNSYQTIMGFGGAFTEAASYVWSQLNSTWQEYVLQMYFNDDPSIGNGYTVARVHMNSCDFCLASYNEDNVTGDYNLTHFSIDHDQKWLIPFIKAAQRTSQEGFRLFLTPWSPPPWMKINGQMDGSATPYGLINSDDVFASWALFYSKFITAYQDEGIPIWGLTVQNEAAFAAPWEACVYTPEYERNFVRDYLGPRISMDHPNVSIMIWDHNRDVIVDWADTIFNDTEAAQYVAGTAFHWYVNGLYENLATVHDRFPDKFLLATEACMCPPDLGNWNRGETYAYDIFNDLQNWVVGWTDWNMILDMQGGPNHLNNFCDAPMLADTTNQIVYLQNSYWYMGHFSRFARPGAMRIDADCSYNNVSCVAFVSPDQASVSTIVMNTNDVPVTFALNYPGYGNGAMITLPAHAIGSYVFESGLPKKDI